MKPTPIPILMYHKVGEPVLSKGDTFLNVSAEDFAKQMRLLKRWGYTARTFGEVLGAWTTQKPLPPRTFVITFDDGYVNNLTHALPVLQQHGFTSTCYAVSQLLGKTNAWDIPTGIAQVPLMTAAQLQQWVDGGQQVGAHTRNHVHLPDISAEECAKEIAMGRQELEASAASTVAHFCYPYGDFNAETRAAVGAAGFESATTTRRGRCRAGDAMLELPRVPILRSTTRLVFWLKIASRYEDRRRV